jgi:acyl-CoA thioester hydrolase
VNASEGFHDHEVRVRYGETDQMGIVYHAVYFAYFEVGRTEWLRARGLAYRDVEARGARLAVIEAGARYLAPARYDDVLDVRTRVADLGHASITFTYEVRRDGRTLATGSTRLACLDESGRVRPLPDDVLGLAGPASVD